MANKPSWDDAPEWANYFAQDGNGAWWWYETKPEWHEGQWVVVAGGKYDPAEAVMVDAETTLEARP